MKLVKFSARAINSKTNIEKEYRINLDQITYVEIEQNSIIIFFSNGNGLYKHFEPNSSDLDEKGHVIPKSKDELEKEITEFLESLGIEIIK